MSDRLGSLELAAAELVVHTTDGEEYRIDAGDRQAGVLLATIEQHARDQIDQAEIELLNLDGRYGTDQRITRGDRIEWHTRLAGEAELTHRWSGQVEDVAYRRTSQESRTVTLEADDYVFGILSDRIAFRSFVDEFIVDIIADLVGNEAPELDVDLPSTDEIDDRATVTANGRNVLEVIEELALQADAYLFADGTTLRMRRVRDLETVLSIGEDTADAIIGTDYEYREEPSDLATFVRVNGSDASAEDDTQLDHDAEATVTASDRLAEQISPTRSKLDRVELIPFETGSGESITVRVQRANADGTGPVAPDDPTADIVSRTLQPDDPRWTNGGESDWLLNEHVAHDEDPFMLVESTGPDGQDVAVDADGNLRYRTFYAYPILAEASDADAEAAFGRVERSVEDRSLRTITAAGRKAEATLEENNQPRELFSADARSPAVFELAFADVVSLDFPNEAATGRFVVQDRVDTFGQATDLRSRYTFRSLDSL